MANHLAAVRGPDAALAFIDEQLAAQAADARLAAALNELRGTCCARARRYDEAEAAFKKALALAPDRLSAHFALADLYLRRNETPKAIARYEEVLKAAPDNVSAYMRLGVIHETAGAFGPAEAMYAKALEHAPDFAPALNNLAWILLQQGKDPERAFALAAKARKLMPDDPGVADTYGSALIARGLFATAITTLRDAVAKNPRSPALWLHLAIAYWRHGRSEQARSALAEAFLLSALPWARR